MKTIQKLVLFLAFVGALCTFVGATRAYGTIITSNGTGPWALGSTWAGGMVPGSSDDVVIRPGDVVTVGADATVNSVTFANTAGGIGSISVSAGFTLTVSTNITFQNSASISTSASLTGAGTINVLGSVSIGNTIAPTASRTMTVTSTIAALNVSGNVTLTSQRSGGGSTNNPTLQISSGVVSIAGTLASVTATNAASIATVTLQTAPQSGTLNLGGSPAYTTSGSPGVSTFSFNGTTSTVNYNGTAAQTVRNVTYRTLKINNSVGATMAGTANVTTLTIGDVSANSIFNDGGFQVTSAGTINLTSGAFNLGSAGTATTWPLFATRNINAGTTIGYISGVAQTVSLTPNYQNLALSGGGQKNSSGSINVAQDLTNASVLDMSGFGLSVSGVINNSGTIRFSGGTNGLAISSGTIEYYGASQTVGSGTYNNLKINQSSGDAILGGNTTVTGVLSLTARNLNIAGFDLILESTATISVVGPSSSKMIIASGGSEVKKVFIGNGSFTFPIGDNSGTVEYSPVTIDVTGSAYGLPPTAYIGVSVVDAKHPSNASSVNYITRYWEVAQSGITNCTVTVTGNYVAADIVGAEASASAAQVAGVFNQTLNPWIKYVALGSTGVNQLKATGATILAGQTSDFTGITGANPTVSISTGVGVSTCAGTPVTLTTTAGGDPGFVYSWNPSSGLNNAVAASPIANPSVTTTYTVTTTDGNGITATNNTMVTVDPIPVITNGVLTQTICNTGSAVFTPVISVASSTYQWSSTVVSGSVSGVTAGPVSNTGLNDNLTNTGIVPAVVRYHFTPTGPGGTSCLGATVDYVVTVNPAPDVSASDQRICSGTSSNVVISNPNGVSGTTFSWTVGTVSGVAGASGGSGAVISQMLTSSVVGSTVNYNITPSANGCAGTAIPVVVTVDPIPVGTGVIAGTYRFCSGTLLGIAPALSVGSVAVSTFSWSGSNGSGGVGNITDTPVNTGNAPMDITYTVVPKGPSPTLCVGAPFTIVVTVDPIPVITNGVLTQTICNTGSAVFTPVISVASSTYQWSSTVVSGSVSGVTAGPVSNTGLNDNLTNTGIVPAVVRYHFTPTGPGGTSCLGATVDYVVTVNPAPDVSASDQRICSGTSSNVVISNPNGVSGTTFSWTVGTVSGVAGASGGSGAVISQMLTSSVVGSTVNYSITPSANGCAGTAIPVVVTVDPIPVGTGVIAGTYRFCSGTLLGIAPALSVGSVAVSTFSWSGSNGSGGVGNITDTPVNTGNAPMDITYTVVPKGPSPTLCVGAPFTIVVTVDPIPVITNGVLTQTICNTGSAVFTPVISVASSTYQWSSTVVSGSVSGVTAGPVSNTGLNDNLTNTGIVPAVVRYHFTPTGPGGTSCLGATVDYVVTVNPAPDVSASDQRICSGTSSNVVISNPNGVSGTTFSWTVGTVSGVAGASGGSGAVISQVLTSSVVGSTVNYNITPSANGCAGTAIPVVVTVDPIPVGTGVIAGTYRFCSGTLLGIAPALSVGSVAVSTFSWSGSNGSGGVGNITDTPVNTGNAPMDITYTVVPKGPSPTLCVGAPFTIVVTVDPIPVITNGVLTQTICNTGSAVFTPVISVASSTYQWSSTVVSGSVSGVTAGPVSNTGLNDNLTNTGIVPAVVRYHFTPTGPGGTSCLGATVDYVVTVNPAPDVSASDQRICSGTSSNVVISNPNGVSGTTFSWTVGTVSGVAGASGGSGTVISQVLTSSVVGSTVNYSITPSANGCSGSPITRTVTVDPIPVGVPVGAGANVICSGTPLSIPPTLSVGSVAVTTFSWSGSNGSGGSGSINDSPVNGTDNPFNVTYTVIPTGPSPTSCVGASFPIVVTVNPNPVFSVTNSSPAICSGSKTNLLFNSSTTGHQINVFSVSYGAVTGGTVTGTSKFFDSNTLKETLTNATNAPIDVVYVFNVTTPGTTPVCPVTTVNQSYTVRVNPIPTVSASNQRICSGTSSNVVISNPNGVSGTTFSWTVGTVSGVAGASGGSGTVISQVLTSSVVGSTVNYSITPSANGCSGSPITRTVTVDPIPVGVPVGAGANVICSGTPLSIPPTLSVGSVAVTTFSWSGSNGSGGSGSINDSPVNGTDNPFNVTYTVIPTGPSPTSCVGASFPIVVTVNPNPVFSVTNSSPAICSGSKTNLLFNSSTTGHQINVFSVSYGAVTGGTVTGTSKFFDSNTLKETLTNATNAPIDVVYVFNVTTPGTTPVCPVTTVNQSYTVRVNPIPTVSASNQRICSGTSSNVVISNPNGVSGTTFSWTVGTVSGVAGASGGSGTVISQVLTSSVVGSTVNYSITPSANGCSGSPITRTVTVDPIPVGVPVGAGANVICSGTPLSIPPTLSVGSVAVTTFSWSGSNGSGGSGSINDSPVNGTDNPFNVTYTVIPTGPSPTSCVGASFPIVVTVNPNPVFSVTNSSPAICSGSKTNLLFNSSTTGHQINVFSVSYGAVTGGTVTGTSKFFDSNTLKETLTNATNAPIDVVYVFNVTTPGTTPVCPVTTVNQSYTVRVNPIPTVSASNQRICSGTSSNVVISNPNGVSGTTFSWTVGTVSGVAGASGGSGTVISQVLTSSVVGSTVNYSITPSANGCSGSPITRTVTVDPIPVGVPVGAGANVICSGTPLSIPPTLSVGSVAVTTFSWSGSNGSGGSGSINDSPVNGTDNPFNVTYTVIPTGPSPTSCVGASFPIVVTVNPNPVFSVTNSSPAICSGSKTNLLFNSSTTGHQINVFSVSYGAVTGGTVTGTSKFFDSNTLKETLTNATNAPIDVVYVFNVTTPGTTPVCPVTTVNQSYTVRVNPIPTVSASNQRICSGTSSNVVISNPNGVSGTTFSWTVGTVSGVAGASGGSGTVISQVLTSSVVGSTVNYSITPSANGCSGSPITRTVTVDPIPVGVPVGAGANVICSGTPLSIPPTLSVGSVAVTTFSWSGSNGSGGSGSINDSPVNGTDNPFNVTYTVIPTGPSPTSCVGASFPIVVTVNPNPVFSVTNSSPAICSGSKTNLLFNSSTTGHQINVFSVSYGAVTGGTVTGTSKFFDSNTLKETLTNATNAPIDVVYVFNVTTPGTTPVCPVTTVNQSYTVRVNPIPTVSASNQRICSGTSSNVVISNPNGVSGTTFSWTVGTVSGVAGASGGSGTVISQVLTSSVVGSTVNYSITPSANGCSGSPITRTVTVDPIPVGVPVGAGANVICSGTPLSIPPTLSVGSVAVTTFSWSGSNGSGGSGSINDSPVNGTDNPFNVTYTVIPTGPSPTSCVGASFPIVVTVNPNPVFSVTNSSPAICSGSKTNLLFNSSTTGHQINVFSVSYGAVTGGTVTGTSKFFDSNTLKETLTNATNAPIDVVYVFNVTTPGTTPVCPVTTVNQSYTVRVNPIPTVSASNQRICSGTSSNVVISNPNGVSGTTFSWTVGTVSGVAGASGGSGTVISQVLTSSVVGSTVNYSITPSANGCSGSPITRTVTVDPIPVGVPVGAGANVICSGTPLSIPPTLSVGSVAVTTFSWSGSNGSGGSGSINDSPVNGTDNPFNVTYTVIPTGPSPTSCVGASFPIVVTVNPNPVFSVTNSSPAICSGSKTNLLFNSSTTGHQINVFSVSYGAVTGGTVTGTSKFFDSNTLKETLTNATNAPIDVVYVFNVTTPGTTPVCPVTTVNQSYTVRVNPIPTVSASNQRICSGSTSNVAISNPNGVSGTTFSWTVLSSTNVSGATGSGGNKIAQALTSIDGFTIGTVTYRVTPSANGCSGAFTDITVMVDPVPTLSINGTVFAVCDGGTPAISLTNPNGVTGVQYEWTVVSTGVAGASSSAGPSGAPLINQALTLSTPNMAGSVVYTVWAKALGCVSSPVQTVTVNVNPIPDAAANTQTICSGQTSNVMITNPNGVTGTTYTWTAAILNGAPTGFADGGGSVISQMLNTNNSQGKVRYTITPSANGCAGTAINVDVVVNPVPTASVSNQVICSGTSTNIALNNPNLVAGTQYFWTVVQSNVTGASGRGTIGAPVSGPIAQLLTASSSAGGKATYTITPVVGTASCPGIPVIATVTVNAVPDALATPATQTICSASTTNIALSNPNGVNGTTFNWTVSPTNVTGASIGGGNTISQVLSSTTGNTPGSVTYTITPSANGCNGTSSTTATITVNPNPTLAVNNTVFTVCDGQTPSIRLSNPDTVAGVGYVWTVMSSNLTGASDQTVPVAAGAINTALNLVISNAPGSVVYNVQSVANGCYSGVQTVTVNVNPIPSANGTDITICSGQNAFVVIDATPQNVSGTTFSWVVIPTSNVSGASNGNGSTINQILNLTNYSIGSVIYRITPSANGCAGPTKDVTVTVDPIALVNAGVDYEVCQPSTISLTGSIGGAATSGTWQIVTGGGSISVSTVSDTTVTATYTVAAGDITNTVVFNLVTNDPDGSTLPCNPASGTLHVAVNKAATVTLPSDYTVCEPSTIFLTGTIGGSATSGLWSVVSGAGVLTATNVSGSTVTANYSVDPSDISNVVVFRLTTNDPDGLGPCIPVFSDIHITINRAARVFAPANLALCEDTPGIALGASIGGSTSTTVWSGGLGSFNNINDPNAIYNFKNPDEVNTTIVLTITALDPDSVGPCTSVSTQTNLKINPLPIVVFSGFPPGVPTQMAENLAPITLTGNQIGGLFTILPSTSNIGSTSQSPVDRAAFDPGAVKLGTNIVTYTYTDGNGCTNSNSQSIIINPVTTVDFTIQSGYLNPSFEWEICANQFNSFTVPNPSPSLVKLIGKPVASTGGTPETNFTASAGINNPTNVMNIIHIGSEYYIETSGLPSDTYVVTYTYKNSFNAITSKLYGVIVHAGPVAKIDVANNCISSAIQFHDNSSPKNDTIPPPADPIVFWKWDFKDGSAPVFSQNPSHVYTNPKVYRVLLQVATSFGCSDTTSRPVRVGAVPVVKFTASSICNNDRTRFTDQTTNPNHVSHITKYTWDFGDNTKPLSGDSTWYANWNKGLVNVDTVYTIVPPLYKVVPPDSAGFAGSFKIPLHRYAVYGTYHPKLTVNTNDGCVNSYQKSIFILPYSTVKPLATNAYREDFEATNGGYQIESKTPMDSSWIWATPNGKVINGGSKSWWTGLFNGTYGPAESSVVNGPCFNLDSLSRPMISFDFWINTPNSNNDGAALQYSTDGGITWLNVGVPNQGINWYSSRLIVSNPGDQPVGFGPYGWSGDDQKMWMKASFNLDGLPKKKPGDLTSPRSQVRIRFSFAGDSSKNIQGRFNGFAFDNVFVGNKTRNVLVEEFTNATKTESLNADSHFETLFSLDSASRKGSTDFNGIQYHVRFPKPDIFSQADTDDPAARALYYGIQQVPYSMLDGLPTDDLQSVTPPATAGDYNNINLIEIDRRALRTPPLTILQIDTVNTSQGWTYNNHSITAKVNVRADTAITYPLYAQVALVENPINVNGVRYQNVVRQLLYAGDGVTKSVIMAKNDTQVFAKGNVEINFRPQDSTKLFLIAFVQNFATKEILQSSIMPVIKKYRTFVTGIEPSIAELEQIQIYPNPANAKFSFSTTAGDFPSNSIWKISDQRGINVMEGNFNDAVKGVKAVDISSLTNGVYFVAIGAPDRNPVYMKLVVMNDAN